MVQMQRKVWTGTKDAGQKAHSHNNFPKKCNDISHYTLYKLWVYCGKTMSWTVLSQHDINLVNSKMFSK